MVSKDIALADVKSRREAVQRSIEALKARLSPEQLAEDALSVIDPDLTFLGRIRSRIEHNKLLSLAVLAGAGWLFGGSARQSDSKNEMRTAGTAQSPTRAKEKHHDSGQGSGERWNNAGDANPESRFQEDSKPQTDDGNGKAGEEIDHPVRHRQEAEQRSPEEQRP